MKLFRYGLVVLLAALWVASCNKPKRSSASPAPTADAQRQECEARGENFRWENNACVSVKTDQQLCVERPGYVWQNGQCVQEQLSPQEQCIRNGGQWIDGACVANGGIGQQNSCQEMSTPTGAMNCIQVRANELEAYLRTRGGFSWYNNVESDLETIREKNLELKQAQIQSLDNVSFIQKHSLCWDLRTMTNQKAQISTKLRLSGEGELERAEPFLNNFNTAVDYTKQLLKCNSVIY